MSLARIIPLASVLLIPVPAFARGWHEPAGRAVGPARAYGHMPGPARVVVEPRWYHPRPFVVARPVYGPRWVAPRWVWNGVQWIWVPAAWAGVPMTPPVVAPMPVPAYAPVAPAQPAYYGPEGAPPPPPVAQ